MEKRKWSDAVLMVNGQPVQVLPKMDFGGEEPDTSTFNGVTSITLPLRTTGKTMELLAKEISKTNLAFARLMAGPISRLLATVFIRGWRDGIHEPPQPAADKAATTQTTTNQKQSKTMKVKIKGISELESAKYAFDNGGNLIRSAPQCGYRKRGVQHIPSGTGRGHLRRLAKIGLKC